MSLTLNAEMSSFMTPLITLPSLSEFVFFFFMKLTHCSESLYLHNFVCVDNDLGTTAVAHGLSVMQDHASFSWMLSQFVELMDNVAPAFIFTDRDAAMSKAIETAMPDTTHMLCVWHLACSIRTNIQAYLKDEWSRYISEFWRIQQLVDELEFHSEWEKLTSKLPDGAQVYIRNYINPDVKKWANCFRASKPTLCVQSTQRAEGSFGIAKRNASRYNNILTLAQILEKIDHRRQAQKAALEATGSSIACDFANDGMKAFLDEVGKYFTPGVTKHIREEMRQGIGNYEISTSEELVEEVTSKTELEADMPAQEAEPEVNSGDLEDPAATEDVENHTPNGAIADDGQEVVPDTTSTAAKALMADVQQLELNPTIAARIETRNRSVWKVVRIATTK